MKSLTYILRTTLLIGALFVLADPASAGIRLGGGVHYLRALGDIKDDPNLDENAFALLGSADFRTPLLRVEGDVEVIPDYYSSSLLMIQPQAYALLGSFFYGGVGVGVGHLEEFGWQDPFFALRAGLDFVLGSLDLDVFASYRFQKNDELSSIDEDSLNSLTFAALVRFGG